MLNEVQIQVIKNRINAETDIPLLREDAEGKLIALAVDTINPKLEPALRSICPKPFVDALKLALDPTLPHSEKRLQISKILTSDLEEALTNKFAGSLDQSLVPPDVEHNLMRQIAQKLIEELVTWTVAEIDTRLTDRLAETQAAVDALPPPPPPPAPVETAVKNDALPPSPPTPVETAVKDERPNNRNCTIM